MAFRYDSGYVSVVDYRGTVQKPVPVGYGKPDYGYGFRPGCRRRYAPYCIFGRFQESFLIKQVSAGVSCNGQLGKYSDCRFRFRRLAYVFNDMAGIAHAVAKLYLWCRGSHPQIAEILKVHRNSHR